LLHAGADPNFVDEGSGQSLLARLCGGWDGFPSQSAASLALDKGAHKTINFRSRDPNFGEMTALHYACRSSELCSSLIEQLIRAKADVNSQDGKGHTPLWHAANWSRMQHADILIRNGARVDDRGPGSTTPLIEAARYNSLKLVMRLVEEGADVNAVSKEDYELLSEDGADVNVASDEKYVLLGPIERPDVDNKIIILRYLLANGANPTPPADFHDNPFWTP
jgi:ankyrin repeat protein